MHIPLAVFSDHATVHPTDGKLYLIGAGIKSLPFARFPGSHPHLSLALGIEVEPDELGTDHTLSIESRGPTDEPVSPAVNITFAVPPGRHPSRSGYVHFVSDMENSAFPVEGVYTFLVSIDGNQLQEIAIRAERSDDAKLAAEAKALQEAKKLLDDGYAAFNEGKSDAAEAAFRALTDRFPNVAGGHNNLGFVLLAKGEAEAALEAFAVAKKLGYPQDEIVDANAACALYVSGDATGAVRGFVDCLQTHIFRTGATLFGIGPSGLFAIGVDSAAEYASLMALNAAWSAHRAGDAAATTHYLAGARAGELMQKGDQGGPLFTESVNALEVKAGHGAQT